MTDSTNPLLPGVLPLMQHASCERGMRASLDAHCHLGLMRNGTEVAAQAADRSLRLFSMGVLPGRFADERARFAPYPNVAVGLGLHPWYVDPEGVDAQLEAFAAELPCATLVGEVGLDFGRAHAHTAAAQTAALTRILDLVAREEGRCLSLHAVRAAGVTLDLLEESGVLAHNVAIFHWFSGTSEELHRAVRLGAYFSVGERMLATRRGRAYARSIPVERLLLETDLPVHPGEACSAAQIAESLSRADRFGGPSA